MAVKKNGTIIGHLLSIVGLLVIYEERREDTMHSGKNSYYFYQCIESYHTVMIILYGR